MGIVSVKYTKLDVTKTGNTNQKLSISTTPKIEDVSAGKLKAFGNDSEIANIRFSFKSVFEPNVASLDIEGIVIYTGDNTKEIVDSWKKDKKVPADAHIEIMNNLFKTAGIKALQLSEMADLPPVIALPKLKKNQETQ